jgi:hypothetical protein
MMAGVWLPNILQVVWWRFNAWGYLASWIANLGISWLVVWVLPAWGVIPAMPDYLQFWMLMVLGAAVFLPATLLTRPEPMDRLVSYYAMTRPMGWWKPVHREALKRGLIRLAAARPAGAGSRPFIRRRWTAEEAQTWSREDWIAIVLSPFVFAGILFGVTGMLLMRAAGFWTALAAAAGGAIMYYAVDPKLRAVSTEYGTRQAGYLNEVERRSDWDGRVTDEGGRRDG